MNHFLHEKLKWMRRAPRYALPLDGSELIDVYRAPDSSEMAGAVTLSEVASAGLTSSGVTGFADVADLTAAIIPAEILAVDVRSWAKANPGNNKPHRFVRIAAPSVTEQGKSWTHQSADGAWWDLQEPEPHVSIFGALGAGDDTATINAGIDYVRRRTSASTVANKYFLHGSGVVLTTLGSIDATAIRGEHHWGLKDFHIWAKCTDKVVLDLAGSRFATLEDIYIWCDESMSPYSGIQVCRINLSGDFPAAGSHAFNRVTVDGHAKYASFHNYGSECNTYMRCQFWNRRSVSGADEAWPVIMDGDGKKVVQSDFQVIATAVSHAFNENVFIGSEARKVLGTGSALFLAGPVQHRWIGCYGVAVGAPFCVIDGDAGIKDLTLDMHMEGSWTSAVHFIGTAGTKSIYGLRLTDHHANTTVVPTAYFTCNGPTLVKIYDLEWSVITTETPAGALFDTPSKYGIYNARFRLPSFAALNTPISGFTVFAAQVYARDEAFARHYGNPKFISDLTIYGIDEGNSFGPELHLDRDSASPAANDSIGQLTFDGRSSTGVSRRYANIRALILDPTNAAEKGQVRLAAMTAGTLTNIARFDHDDGFHMMDAGIVIDSKRHFRLRSYTIATLPSANPAGQMIHCSDLGGGGGQLNSNGTAWRRVSRGGTETRSTDADFTLTTLTSGEEQEYTGTTTAARTITLSTTRAYAGARFRVAHNGPATAFAWTLNLGGLTTLVPGAWAEVIYNGSAWGLVNRGTNPAVYGTVTVTGGAADLHALTGRLTTESLTTAAGANYGCTITDMLVKDTDIVLVSVHNHGAGHAALPNVTVNNGSFQIIIWNIHPTDAFNNVLTFSFVVVKT